MRFRFTLYNILEGTKVLDREPKGWDKTELLFKRHSKYHGLFLDFSVKLEFYCGAGKEFIDDVYQNQGIDAEITILIEVDCNGSGSYETLYNGQIDLKSWESNGNIGTRDSFTTVTIIEIGIAETVVKRIKEKINLSELETLDGTALTAFTFGSYDLNLHSKTIRLRSLMTGVSITDATSFIGFTTPRDLFIEIPLTSTTYDEVGVSVVTAPHGYDSSAGAVEPIFTAVSTTSLTVDYNLIFDFTETNNSNERIFTLRVAYKNGTTFAAATETILASYGPLTDVEDDAIIQAINLTGSFSPTVSAGSKLWVYLKLDDYDTVPSGTTTSTGYSITVNTLTVELSKDTTTTATTCKAFAIHEAGARIAQSITNQLDAFRSDFFGRKNSQPNTYSSNGCGSFTALTNGFQIRKFPITDRPIYMSLDDYFEGLNAIYNLGLGIEVGGSGYVIRIEPKEYFYSTNVLMRVGNIPDMKVVNGEEYYFNSLKIGYDKWQTENINGTEEFNSKREYSTLLKKIDKEIMAVSKFIAGGYALEVARRQLYNSSYATIDYKYDNENFIICLNRSVDGSGNPNTLTTAEKNENYTTISNVLVPSTSYNLRISPSRNALRWNSVLSPGLIKKPGTSLKMTYKEGNALMESRFTADTCEGNYNNELFTENQDIQWDGANTQNLPIWIPEIYEFDYPLSFTDYKNIKANPTYCLEISRTTSDYIKAYIIDIRYKPVIGMATFKLLRANA